MEKNRQYRSNQGRSDEKVRKNNKLMFIVLISFFIVLLLTFLDSRGYV
jgi:hypothetical protein